MSINIVSENSLPGTYTLPEMMPSAERGDLTVAGFARQASVNVGETVQFSVNGPATVVRIFRAGYYSNAKGFREVATITNTPTTQPAAATIANSNGATSCSNWSVTASWDVPAGAVSGIYMAMIRNAANTDAFYATFVVRDDAAVADVIYKTSDATWQAAYNHFGTIAAPDGKNVYGAGTGVGNIMERCYATSYHRPVITRGGAIQTYWWACELPLIRFLERNGLSVKYVTSVDLDKTGVSLLTGKAKIFLSSGHDEYWTEPMRTAIEAWRDGHGGRSIFMSGNEVFWKARYQYIGDEAILWCHKDSMPGPTGVSRAAGQPLDPVSWTGTWMDTRWPGHRDGALLTGTRFGMNGIYDYDAVIPQNPYAGLKVWGGSALVDGQITLTRVMGFEADHAHPTQPSESVRILAGYTRAAPGGLSDANGQLYNVPGNIEWGIVAQRYAGGGLTVGFGTCQWSWALDNVHDRGASTPVSLAAQQFTINLLRDLGATPVTPMPGVSVRPVNSLDEYGTVPGGVPDPGYDGQGWRFFNGDIATPFTLVDGVLVQLAESDTIPTTPPPDPDPDPDPGEEDADWAALFAARNFPALDAWYVSHTGHRVPPTATVGDDVVDAAWLADRQATGNASLSGGRWTVTNLRLGNIRIFGVNDITFRDCVIESGGSGHGVTSGYGENPTGIIIEHCTINGQGADWLGVVFPAATAVDQIIVRYCDISGFRCGVQVFAGMTLEYNHIHDLAYPEPDPHVTSVSIRSRNVRVYRNRLADGNSSALAFYNENSPYTNIVAEQNVVSTGQSAYEITYVGSYPVGANIVRLVGNLLQRGARAWQAGNFSEITGNVNAAGAVVD